MYLHPKLELIRDFQAAHVRNQLKQEMDMVVEEAVQIFHSSPVDVAGDDAEAW